MTGHAERGVPDRRGHHTDLRGRANTVHPPTDRSPGSADEHRTSIRSFSLRPNQIDRKTVSPSRLHERDTCTVRRDSRPVSVPAILSRNFTRHLSQALRRFAARRVAPTSLLAACFSCSLSICPGVLSLGDSASSNAVAIPVPRCPPRPIRLAALSQPAFHASVLGPLSSRPKCLQKRVDIVSITFHDVFE